MCQYDHITYQCGQYRQLCFIAIVSRINVISIASNYAISIMSMQSELCLCNQYHVNPISITCANAVSITSMQSELCWHHMYQYQYYVSQQSLSYVSCITVDSIYVSLVISGMTWHLVGDVEMWERVSLASHTLCRERKGLVMLQLPSCCRGTQLLNIAVG